MPPEDEKMPLSLLLTKSWYDNILNATINDYHRNSDHYSTDERLIRGIAQQLDWSGQVTQAIRIFELNATLFPDSDNAKRQLADAYLEKGDTSQALRYYKIIPRNLQDDPYIKEIVYRFDGESG